MSVHDRETIIQMYFDMWVHRDFSILDTLFASNIYYSECYGPEYTGLNEIHLWIDDMLRKQKVLEWRVKRFIHANNTVVVEWVFRDVHNNTQNSFDGVSIIEFESDERISSIKEFGSKSEHANPYRKKGR